MLSRALDPNIFLTVGHHSLLEVHKLARWDAMLWTPVRFIPEGRNGRAHGAALAGLLCVAQAWGVSHILKPAKAVILKAGLSPIHQCCELTMPWTLVRCHLKGGKRRGRHAGPDIFHWMAGVHRILCIPL